MAQVTRKEMLEAAQRAAAIGGTMIAQVPDIPDGEPFADEWRAFKREVNRLVAEGQAGRFALLKGDHLVGVWDTLNDADQAGRHAFPGQRFLVQEIQLYIAPLRWGYYRSCRA